MGYSPGWDQGWVLQGILTALFPCGPKKTEFLDKSSMHIDKVQAFSDCREALVMMNLHSCD